MDTIAPDSTRARRVLWIFGGLAIAGAIATVAGYPYRGGSPAAARPFEYGVAMLGLGAFAAAYMWLWLRNTRLLVSVDRFGLRDAFGRDQVWTPSQVGRVVDVAVSDAKGASARRLIYFLRPDGSRLFMLNPNAWSGNAIDRIVRATGRPLEQRPEPMTRAAFAAGFPRATTWVGRHQNVTLVLILAIPLAAAIAITLVQR